jgi:2-keto-3-deoxy-L-rhamnonate aldolase RhmA
VINVVLIEDQAGIEIARDIVGTPGVTVAIPGPGDLRRAYDGDMEAVEAAIQTVLAACLEFDVPCGITAGVDDIVQRIEEGFRFFIVTQAEAITIGREAAGRGE